MKKTISLLLIILSLSVLSSCEKHKNEKHEHTSETKKTEDQQHSSSERIRLNNGELWIANKETTEGVNRMIALMNSFSDKESVKAYSNLKMNLDKEFGMILKECTMKGESHNQLHHFLLPMQEMFEGLASSDLHVCKKNYEQLNKHLKEYAIYFK